MKKNVLIGIILAFVSFSLVFPTNQIQAAPTTTTLNGAAGEDVTEATLDELNPLKQPGVDQSIAKDLNTPGGIVTRFLTVFALPLAGLILFVMLLWGGFEMLTGAADKKSLDAGKQRITAALIGFMLLFVSYWMAKILELMFGITIV